MEFILKIDGYDSIEEKEVPEKIKDILVIEELPDEVIYEINVYEVCKVPFFYACDKAEMISVLQPHSTDIAITQPSKANWQKELEGLCNILGFRSSIYIVDNEGVHDSIVESWLYRHGYTCSKEGEILGMKVFEYEKGLEVSVIDCFNKNYTTDIFSVIFVSAIDFSTVVYCDVVELIDLFYYAVKGDKNVFMPVPFNQIDFVTNYLDGKTEHTNKVDDKLQFQLF